MESDYSWFSETFKNVGNTLITSLPTSPIVWIQSNTEIEKYIRWFNWFVPVYTVIGIFEAWWTCIIVYYFLQIALRWFKFIE